PAEPSMSEQPASEPKNVANPESWTETAVGPPATATRVFPAPTGAPEVPGYEIMGTLGRGGMGVVYKALHRKLNRVVALKMVLGGTGSGADDRQRFRGEAEAVARLQHPNIVQVFEVGDWRPPGAAEPLPYFSLELVEGGNLAQTVNGTPVPAAVAARVIEPLA